MKLGDRLGGHLVSGHIDTVGRIDSIAQVGESVVVRVSFDKQFVRDYLETLDWNKTAPGPELPDEIVTKTAEKYEYAKKLLME